MSEELIQEIGYSGQDVDVVDDDGSTILDGKTLVEDKSEKPAEKSDKTPDGEKTVEKQENITGNDGTKGKEVDVKKDGKISGFASRFLKTDEKGGSVFDADGALSFIKPGDGKDASFRYELKPRKQAEKQTDGKPAEAVNPFKQRIEERKKWREGREGDTYLWKNKYSEALQAGYEPGAALQYADGKVREYIEEKQAEWEYEQETKTAEERHKGELSAKQLGEARTARIANEQRYVQRLGGYEQYNELLFGKKLADGKMQQGYASDFVNKLFDVMNPDVAEITPEAMNNWWDKFGADPGNLQIVFDVAMARLQQELFPHLMQKAVTVHKETERQKNMAKQRSGGQSIQQLSPEVGGMPEDLAGFLRPPNSNEAADTI